MLSYILCGDISLAVINKSTLTFPSQAKIILKKHLTNQSHWRIFLYRMKNMIRERREELGISQGELARKAGCAREQINRIENEKTKDPRISLCKKIAKALYVDVDKLWV